MNEREELRCRTVEAGENEGQKREGKPEKTEGRASDKMGTMPMNPLLLSMALPMMVSMLVQALYNIVDSVFVSMINEEALTAVSLAFPIQSMRCFPEAWGKKIRKARIKRRKTAFSWRFCPASFS